MIQFIKRHFGAFIAGILGTATFLYFIDPIMKFVAEMVIRVYGSISDTFVDSIFAYVSQLETYDYSYYLIHLTLLIAGGYAFGWTAAIWFKSERKNDDADVTANPLPGKILASVVLIGFAISALSFAAIRSYQFRILSSFKYHMRIVAPYIDQQQEEMIISRWSLMETEAEFDAIYAYLNEVADKNKIELKENRIY
jgi:hypothetical protein